MNGESSGSDKRTRLSALAGESFEVWWNRYVHGRLLNRDHREQARDGWLAREAQLRATVAGALEWAAGWIETSATDATREFARNMAMTIRAQRGAWSSGSAPLSAASTSDPRDVEDRFLATQLARQRDRCEHGGKDSPVRCHQCTVETAVALLTASSSEGRSLPEILATARSSEAYRQETAALDAAESHVATHTVTDEMVNRFLSWKLPVAFHPDAGISFKRYFNVEYNAKHGKPPQRHEPMGTNLLTATQAREMLEHVLAAAPSATRGSNK